MRFQKTPKKDPETRAIFAEAGSAIHHNCYIRAELRR